MGFQREPANMTAAMRPQLVDEQVVAVAAPLSAACLHDQTTKMHSRLVRFPNFPRTALRTSLKWASRRPRPTWSRPFPRIAAYFSRPTPIDGKA